MRVHTLWLVGAVVLCAPHAVLAQSPWYVSGSVGIDVRPDQGGPTTIVGPGGATGPGITSSSYNPGPGVALAVGYKLPLGFRLEAEFGYAHGDSDSSSPRSTDGKFPALTGRRLSLQSGGNIDSYSATINAFYDLPALGPLTPYLGAGIGIDRAVAQQAIFTGQNVPGFVRFSGTKTRNLAIAEIGLAFAVEEHLSVVPAYRFEHGFYGKLSQSDEHVFKVGLRYSF